MTIDWSRPIEAVHEDGRVVLITDAKYDGSGDYYSHQVDGDDGGIYFSARDGIAHGRKWRIRNVADTDTVAVKRMTRAEAIDFLNTLPGTIEGRFRVGLPILRGLGFVATSADRFKSAHPEWALRDRSDLIQDVLDFAESKNA